jgi:hypothetical protein
VEKWGKTGLDGLPADKGQRGTDEMQWEWVPFIGVPRVRATRVCTRKREGGDDSAQLAACSRAQCVRAAAASLRGGNAGSFVRTLVSSGKLDEAPKPKDATWHV